ncbi:MAG: hypothetical protein V3R51_05075 [Gammaproteobacteria bacterium]
MKNTLWKVIVVVALFLGFLMGYSIPPMVEVGGVAGHGAERGGEKELTQELLDYYKDLAEEE